MFEHNGAALELPCEVAAANSGKDEIVSRGLRLTEYKTNLQNRFQAPKPR